MFSGCFREGIFRPEVLEEAAVPGGCTHCRARGGVVRENRLLTPGCASRRRPAIPVLLERKISTTLNSFKRGQCLSKGNGCFRETTPNHLLRTVSGISPARTRHECLGVKHRIAWSRCPSLVDCVVHHSLEGISQRSISLKVFPKGLE